jgi:hypothetical protein
MGRAGAGLAFASRDVLADGTLMRPGIAASVDSVAGF